MSARTVRALAPAKVNLTLDVLGKRPDGYHEVRTEILAVGLCDVLEARATEDGAVGLTVEGPWASSDVPSDARNLAVRAAAQVLDAARAAGAAGAEVGLALRLEKHIPSQAGLGGGSSDAAAAWIAARALLAPQLPDALGRAHLAALGSDCVFFLEALHGLASCAGRGELVTPSPGPAPDWWIALAVPACGAATAAVYARVLPADGQRPTLRASRTDSTAEIARAGLRNALEDAAQAAVPELRAWRAALDAAGLGHWRLSGSGSSWFGLYDGELDARGDLERLGRTLAERDLGARLVSVLRPAGHGARLDLDS